MKEVITGKCGVSEMIPFLQDTHGGSLWPGLMSKLANYVPLFGHFNTDFGWCNSLIFPVLREKSGHKYNLLELSCPSYLTSLVYVSTFCRLSSESESFQG